MTPHTLTHMLHSLPPILYINYRNPVSNYSKAPWGLSVLSQVTSIFTSTTISPGTLSRQCPNHYAFRAGQNLPDKEFRYLRTVIVTAAVHWGFGSKLLLEGLPLPLTFQHWAGVSSYTSSFDLAETCVFVKQLLGPLLCDQLLHWYPFSLSYGVNLPSSLTMLLSLILGSSPHLPVSVCGTGTFIQYLQAFLASVLLGNSLLHFSLYLSIRVFPLPRFPSTPVSLASFKYIGGAGISTCCPSDTPFGLSLGPDLPWADEPSPGNLRLSMAWILTMLSLLIPAFSLLSRPAVLSIYLRPTIECSSTTHDYS